MIDEWPIYKNIMTEVDSKGQTRDLKQDNEYEFSENRLYYYSSFTKNEFGEYERTIKVYDISSLNINRIKEIIKSGTNNLESIVGNPIATPTETRANLTEEEQTEPPFLQAIIFSEDNKEFTLHKETIGENFLSSLLYILINVLLDLIISKIRKNVSNTSFRTRVYYIKLQTELLELDTLRKKLEIKKDNLKTLTR